MNSAFLVKMVRAKQLEMEAFEELLPEAVKNRMDHFKADTKEFMKECVVELYLAGADNSKNPEIREQKPRKDKSAAGTRHVKKITIQ